MIGWVEDFVGFTMEFDLGVESLGGDLLDYRSHSDECVCCVCVCGHGDGADTRVDRRHYLGESEGDFHPQPI